MEQLTLVCLIIASIIEVWMASDYSGSIFDEAIICVDCLCFLKRNMFEMTLWDCLYVWDP